MSNKIDMKGNVQETKQNFFRILYTNKTTNKQETNSLMNSSTVMILKWKRKRLGQVELDSVGTYKDRAAALFVGDVEQLFYNVQF